MVLFSLIMQDNGFSAGFLASLEIEFNAAA
jgi:hypothetical protein